MLGFGIVKGLRITMKRFLQKKITQQYPEVKPNLPSRSHGSFGFDFDKCISCNLCANACPNGVIRVDSKKDASGKKVLKQYNMNLGYCLYCGFCTKACPTKAVYFKTDFDTVCYNKADTIYRWKRNDVTENDGDDAAEAAALEETENKAGTTGGAA
jgi:NADH-quinone oxidoreductase subunit I